MNITKKFKGIIVGIIAVAAILSFIFMWLQLSSPSKDASIPDANGNYVPESAALYDPSTLTDEDTQMVSEGDTIEIEKVTLQVADIQTRINQAGETALSARVVLPDGTGKIVFEEDQFLVHGTMFLLRALEEGAGDVPGLAVIGVLKPVTE